MAEKYLFKMKTLYSLLLLFISSNLFGCNNNQTQYNEKPAAMNLQDSTAPGTGNNTDNPIKTGVKMKIKIGDSTFTATLYDNATAAAFKILLPITANMVELNGNEKHFDLSTNLPANASNPKTIHAGDLMLWNSNTLVLFYKTFSTVYNYTRLGKIDDVKGLAAVVGSGSVTVKYELEQ